MAAMTALQRRAERKARNNTALDMNLVSLIDVFTILIFFLLSGASGVETLVSPKAVKLPVSTADQAPKETLVVVVTGDDILAGGRRVAMVADVLAASDDLIPALKRELDVLAARKPVRSDNASASTSAPQAVTIMADKDIPYRLLRKVMATCAQANFSDVSFAVRRKIDA